ncbi:unnamed protein product [Orchesella dallaii]|uniref:Uncharacterized protein n=1 Tax=Orchesella dallaii TaxID=48710 RepID=A0ABP1RM24_9HEXA
MEEETSTNSASNTQILRSLEDEISYLNEELLNANNSVQTFWAPALEQERALRLGTTIHLLEQLQSRDKEITRLQSELNLKEIAKKESGGEEALAGLVKTTTEQPKSACFSSSTADSAQAQTSRDCDCGRISRLLDPQLSSTQRQSRFHSRQKRVALALALLELLFSLYIDWEMQMEASNIDSNDTSTGSTTYLSLEGEEGPNRVTVVEAENNIPIQSQDILEEDPTAIITSSSPTPTRAELLKQLKLKDEKIERLEEELLIIRQEVDPQGLFQLPQIILKDLKRRGRKVAAVTAAAAAVLSPLIPAQIAGFLLFTVGI